MADAGSRGTKKKKSQTRKEENYDEKDLVNTIVLVACLRDYEALRNLVDGGELGETKDAKDAEYAEYAKQGKPVSDELLQEVYISLAIKTFTGRICSDSLNKQTTEILTRNSRQLLYQLFRALIIWNGFGRNEKAIKRLARKFSYDEIAKMFMESIRYSFETFPETISSSEDRADITIEQAKMNIFLALGPAAAGPLSAASKKMGIGDQVGRIEPAKGMEVIANNITDRNEKISFLLDVGLLKETNLPAI